MNKDGVILRIRTKDGKILRITLPQEIYRSIAFPRFLRNLATIASNRSGRRYAERKKPVDGRATLYRRLYGRLYRQGHPLKKLLPLAARTLDERDLEVVTRSLMRDKKKPELTWPDFDVAICHLDAVGALADCSDREASGHVTSYLHKLGIPSNLTPDAYRKRRERLQRIGVKLGPDK
jgi:hypothetical protein